MKRDMDAIRELSMSVGQQVAYTLACYLAEAKPDPNNSSIRKIQMEVPKIPLERAVFNALISAEVWRTGTPIDGITESVTNALLSWMSTQDEVEGNGKIRQEPRKETVIELPLRSFDFS